MRLIAKIAAAGSTYLSRFPILPGSIDDLCDDGKLSQAKVRSVLRDYEEFVQFSSGDDIRVLALAVEFMRQLQNVTRRLEENPESDTRTSAQKPVDRTLCRRIDAGRYGYVRFDIDHFGGRLRVRVSASNPRGVVGAVEADCRRFAVYAARVLLHIARELGPRVGVQLVGRGELSDVFAEAAIINCQCELDDRRRACTRHVGEYCTPADPACPCYFNGRCVAATVKREKENGG